MKITELLTGVNNVMLDLETMGQSSKAAIISIGAVRFDDKIRKKFHMMISLQSSLDKGMEIDTDTIMWWMQQNDNARKQFNSDNEFSLPKALICFSIWAEKNPVIWGNGATFDNVILSNAYKLCDINRPWSYKNDRCYRTVKNMNPDIKATYKGTHHNALDDAENQARHLIQILRS